MSKKILVVDDDEDIVYMLKSVLEKEGYEVATAAEAIAALRLLKSFEADLMIVDLTMPGMSGWHFNTKVRQDERFKSTPIVVLSGLIENEGKAEAFENASVYVAKPFDIFKLMEQVKDLLVKE